MDGKPASKQVAEDQKTGTRPESKQQKSPRKISRKTKTVGTKTKTKL